MKKITFLELANLLGGYSSCADVQYAANTHHAPCNPSKEEMDAEERFWKEWLEAYDSLCM